MNTCSKKWNVMQLKYKAIRIHNIGCKIWIDRFKTMEDKMNTVLKILVGSLLCTILIIVGVGIYKANPKEKISKKGDINALLHDFYMSNR